MQSAEEILKMHFLSERAVVVRDPLHGFHTIDEFKNIPKKATEYPKTEKDAIPPEDVVIGTKGLFEEIREKGNVTLHMKPWDKMQEAWEEI